MTAYSLERLYQHLPTVYRLRDADQGEALKALVAVIGEQVRILEDDIAQLYDNWFIETCEDWVVPYIGDLLGVRGLHDVQKARFGARARVANTLRYRRRKGTASMLEQLALDITGWPARAVEFFELLGTTQHLNHLRPQNVRGSLRHATALEALGTPFDALARTAEVRAIGSERGRYNIPNIGLFLWRLEAYPAPRVVAQPHGDGKYSFSPLGNDIPLFNSRQVEEEITQLARPQNVPDMLSRRVVYDELEARRTALVNGDTIAPVFFGASPVLRVFLPGAPSAVPPEEIAICDLTNWSAPPATKTYTKPDGTQVARAIQLSVDPTLGRLRLRAAAVGDVMVEFQYGFSADMGGGAYLRTLSDAGTTPVLVVQKGGPLASIPAALSAWDTAGKPNAIIEINDSATYGEQVDVVLPAGRTLEIRAAAGQRPVLRVPSNFTITAGAPSGTAVRASLLLDGLVIADHPLELRVGDLGVLRLRDCTLVPGLSLDIDNTPLSKGANSITISAGNRNLELDVERSIVGRLSVGKAESVHLLDSIVDGTGDKALTAATAAIQNSTLIGVVEVDVMELAENSIFTARATAARRQQGCVRFCYVGAAPQLPRLHRCQPQWAGRQAVEAALRSDPNLSATKQAQIRADVESRIRPQFTDLVYGRPAYCQLHRLCPVEITRGSDDESEMGAFHRLQQPQREANLRASLDEYLRAGLEAGIFFVT